MRVRHPEEGQILKPIISDRKVGLDKIEEYLRSVGGVKASSERILRLVSTPEGYNENRRNRIFYNLEKKKLQLAEYMIINDNNELIAVEGKDEDEIVAKWMAIGKDHPERKVYVSLDAVERAAIGEALALTVYYGEEGLLINGMDLPDYDALVAYDKLEEGEEQKDTSEAKGIERG